MLLNETFEYKKENVDGLKESWNFPKIFVNPPYGIDKARGTTRW